MAIKTILVTGTSSYQLTDTDCYLYNTLILTGVLSSDYTIILPKVIQASFTVIVTCYPQFVITFTTNTHASSINTTISGVVEYSSEFPINNGVISIYSDGSNIFSTEKKSSVPIGYPYFQGPHDASPDTLFIGTWTDVSYEEANLTRRVYGTLAGSFFNGVPARLSVSVTSGVPTITIVSGGSGYLNGGSGTISLTIVGACTTPTVQTATITNGVLTVINTTTAGAGYTSVIAIYDGVVGHGDLVQYHLHDFGGYAVPTSTGSSNNNASGSTARLYIWGTGNPVRSGGHSNVRLGEETSGAWITVIKWRRTS